MDILRSIRWRGLWKGVDDPMLYHRYADPDPRAGTVRVINESGFQKWVVWVAGMGFLTDAYDIFALNVVLQMLGYAYWDNTGVVPANAKTALLCSTLGGTAIGQVVFGILGDRYGRARIYGYQLLFLIATTLLVFMSSTGDDHNLDILGSLVAWRTVMGIALGADYPLSASIVVEFAPTHHRAAMLAWVLFMQPIGQIIAQLVALVAVEVAKNSIGINESIICTGECVRSVDIIWRVVVVIGAVPALLAVYFRLTIPESAYWTMDVSQNRGYAALVALANAKKYRDGKEPIQGTQPLEDMAMLQPHTNLVDQTDVHEYRHAQIQTNEGRETATRQSQSFDNVELYAVNQTNTQEYRNPQMQTIERQRPVEPQISPPNGIIRQDGSQNPVAAVNCRLGSPPDPSWSDFKKFFIVEKNWMYLLGTSCTWFLLDFAFYGLGLSSSTVVTAIWYKNPSDGPTAVFSSLETDTWHEIIVLTLGPLIGGALFIITIRYKSTWFFQFWGFAALTGLLLLTGLVFQPARGAGLVFLYVACQIVFNLGPNRTTYMIPAEIFPTRYRCSCHGISAAWGKVGAILAELFFAYANSGESISTPGAPWVGKFTAIASGAMFLGSIFTYLFLPRNIRDGYDRSRSLDALGSGRKFLKELGSGTHYKDKQESST